MKKQIAFLLCLLLISSVLPAAALAQTQLPAAAITITLPQPGEVNPSFITVTGTGVGLPENNVVIQGLDDAGTLLGQTVATVNAELGAEGPWEATLEVRVAPGTTGQIYAYSASPADGSIVADASIQVTFGQAPEPEPTAEPTPEPTAEPTLEPTAEPTPEPIPASIAIDIPLANEVVSNVEVVAQGTGSGLPENNLVVRALSSNGVILSEQPTNVDAGLGGAGPWRVVLTLGLIDPGSVGSIYAFASSPADGSILAEASVPVQFGTPPLPTPTMTPEPTATAVPTAPPEATATPEPTPTAVPTSAPQTPLVRIFSPAEGAVVRTENGVTVSGVASNVFENNVVVSISARGGATLAQQATTADPNGNWSVTLQVGALNAPGTVRAYSTSPVNGAVVAQDVVNVYFQSAVIEPPRPPSIAILAPANGATAQTTGGLVVSGQAINVFENNVIVRVRDSFGQTIRQAVATADASGNWSLAVDLFIANGSPGSIYAFSTSPADGSVMAEDLVNVTFASNCTVRTQWPIYIVQTGDTLFSIAQSTGSTVGELVVANCLPSPNLIHRGQALHVPRLPGEVVVVAPELAISTPELDTTLARNTPFLVEGSAAGTAPGNVFVRALDSNGNVLADVRGETTRVNDAGDRWLWEARLVVPDLPPGTRGMLYAYSLSLPDGAVIAAATQPVIYGEDSGDSYLLITDPLPYATTPGGAFEISGRGRGLFEGNVVVQTLDSAGRPLTLEPVTMSTDEIGGEGEWSAVVELDYVGRGQIVVYSPSPEDGGWMASASVDVVFGDVDTLPSHLLITYPLPNAIVSNETNIYAVAGYVSPAAVDNVFVLVVDEFGDIHYSSPAEVDRTTGFWSLVAEPDVLIETDQKLTLHVVAVSPVDGNILARDRFPLTARPASATVTGNVAYLERIALPEDAIVKMRLVNASLADAPPEMTTEGEQTILNPGQAPIPFVLRYNPANINENMLYSVSARIEDSAGNLLFISTTSNPVITQGNPSEDVEVLVSAP